MAGHILTNAHVVEKCTRLEVVVDGKRASGRVAALARDVDLALLAAVTRYEHTAPLRVPVNMRAGEEVVAVGFPLQSLLSREPIVTTGIVSALAGIRGNPSEIQVSAPLQPGNSGGPIFDLSGNVVGVAVGVLGTLKAAKATGGAVPQNVNFAVNVSEAQKFLDTHRIAWRKRGFEKRRSVADIAADARRFTAYIECYR